MDRVAQHHEGFRCEDEGNTSGNSCPIDEGAVQRAQGLAQPPVLVVPNDQMSPRDEGVGHDDVRAALAPDHQILCLRQLDAASIIDEVTRRHFRPHNRQTSAA